MKQDDRYFVTGGRGPEGATGPNSDLFGPHGDEVSKQLHDAPAVLQENGTPPAKADVQTVGALFGDPPKWLEGQLVRYREDPARYFKPLCAYVAAEVLGDHAHWEEVRDEVERILQEGVHS
jgi:hypothetical protein